MKKFNSDKILSVGRKNSLEEQRLQEYIQSIENDEIRYAVNAKREQRFLLNGVKKNKQTTGKKIRFITILVKC